MASPAGSMRQRNTTPLPTKKKDASSTGIAAPRDQELDALVKANLASKGPGSEWDYKLALVIITALAFVTRFWGISHPNEVVFDEVHFGKVSTLPLKTRTVLQVTVTNPLLHLIVCLVLPTKNILLRCPSTIWQASFCPHGLFRWL